jgi:hypothetical protein
MGSELQGLLPATLMPDRLAQFVCPHNLHKKKGGKTMSNTSDIDRAAARMKSYTGSAVIVFILYWLFWIPGLIVNWMYYNEAKRMEQIAGHSLPGVGCLTLMLWLNVVGVVLGVLFALAMFAGG